MKNYFILIITILWIGLIFTFSSDNKEKSANKSYYIAEKVTPYIRENQNMNFEEINHIIRKTAHFINYTILGVLLVFNARINFRKNIAYVVFFLGLIVACTDEFYQTFVPGREGKYQDVIIDSFGVVFGYCLNLLIFLYCNQKNSKNS